MKVVPLSDEWFREKAHEWISTHGLEEKYLHSLYVAFKEVSRDTRHVCAEMRAENPYQGLVHEWASDYPEYYDKGFHAGQEAHANACMNVGGKL